jgi:hypothetical protein
MHDQLRDEVRTRMGRRRQPSAALSEAQIVLGLTYQTWPLI